jgi:hypothetical protein
MTLRTYQTARWQGKRRVGKVFGRLAGHGFGWRGLFEALDATGVEQGAHLGDGDVVEGGHEGKAEILKTETLKGRG